MSDEVEEAKARLLEIVRLTAENERLRVEAENWKSKAYGEAKGNACHFADYRAAQQRIAELEAELLSEQITRKALVAVNERAEAENEALRAALAAPGSASE